MSEKTNDQGMSEEMSEETKDPLEKGTCACDNPIWDSFEEDYHYCAHCGAPWSKNMWFGQDYDYCDVCRELWEDEKIRFCIHCGEQREKNPWYRKQYGHCKECMNEWCDNPSYTIRYS